MIPGSAEASVAVAPYGGGPLRAFLVGILTWAYIQGPQITPCIDLHRFYGQYDSGDFRRSPRSQQWKGEFDPAVSDIDGLRVGGGQSLWHVPVCG